MGTGEQRAFGRPMLTAPRGSLVRPCLTQTQSWNSRVRTATGSSRPKLDKLRKSAVSCPHCKLGFEASEFDQGLKEADDMLRRFGQ
jgi:hypothetical protein